MSAGCSDDYSLCQSINNSSCYPTAQRCVYQTYRSGSLFCPGLEHLYHCDDFECPSMYKCPGTYCIPTRMLCDQSPDCPNKEDEQDCHDKLVCPGLLRCREENICVHPDDVCDGILHCLLSGDDEMFCDVTDCPESCVCRGSSAKCNATSDNVMYIPTSYLNLRALILSGLRMPSNVQYQEVKLLYLQVKDCTFVKSMITMLVLSKLYQLRFLYLIHNNIEYIQSRAFSKLASLEVLLIKKSQINVLVNFIFTGLQLIPILDLSELHIKSLHSNVFLELTNLKYLNLSTNPLTELQNLLFTSLYQLKSIDLRHTELISIRDYSLFTPNPDVIIHFDESVYCCYVSNQHSCYVQNVLVKKQQECLQITSTRFTFYTIVALLATATILLNLTSMVMLRKRRMYQSHLVLCQHLNATNIVPAIYLLVLCIASSLYNADYIYIKTMWPKSFVCNILFALPGAGFTFTRFCVFLIVLDQMLAIKYTLKQQRLSTIQLLCILYSSMSVIIIWHIARAFHIKISNVSCYPFAVSPTDSPLEWFSRADVMTVSICVVSSASYMYYVIVRKVQNSSKNIRSSHRAGKVVTSIIKNAVVIIGIELVNLLSIALLLITTFYWSSNKPERITLLIAITTFVINSLHVVYFGLKQYI